ncbi:hypothetical protein UFOVP142_9 [uncultured Caudovirales phage]|uniref:Uncharacterized protein n=1 Tax=uncultured Caudovirales phage TaxID=2100421 RepID=A0A6J7XN55_9CAUD|nr:hypothetical protein UFOVP142_9 [uncultured Caudovirales phage]
MLYTVLTYNRLRDALDAYCVKPVEVFIQIDRDSTRHKGRYVSVTFIHSDDHAECSLESYCRDDVEFLRLMGVLVANDSAWFEVPTTTV